MADILLAAPNAQFGQPEVNIGTITGGGGSQRLARAVGKSRAMELVLTGRMWTAQEAVAWGMASRVVDTPTVDASVVVKDELLPVVREAVELAREIAAKSQLAVQAQKEAVNAGAFRSAAALRCVVRVLISLPSPVLAFDQGLEEGLRTERRLFHMTFATADQKEGEWRIFFGRVSCRTLLNRICRHGGLCGEEKAKVHQLVERLLYVATEGKTQTTAF